MRGIYLTYIPSSQGQRKLVPRLEDHVILPEITDYDVMVQVKACGLGRIDTKTLSELLPNAAQLSVGREVSGVVTKVGAAVKTFSAGQEVAGVLPLDTECPGCAEYCVVPEYCLVRKPSKVTHVDCAASLVAGVKAYTALHHMTHMKPGSIVLLCSATSGDGLVMLQMLDALGAKVIAAVCNSEEATLIKKLYPSLLQVVNLSSPQSLVDTCLQETGGLGVNCIIDSGVSPNFSLTDFLIESVPLQHQLEKEPHRHDYESFSSPSPAPTTHQLVSCLATMGQWVTSQPELQLDPPESQVLLMKGASLHFLFEPVWTLSGARTGDYLTVLSNVMDKLELGVIRPYIYKTVVLDQVCEELPKLCQQRVGKVVMRTDTQR